MSKGLTKNAYAYFEIYNPGEADKVTIDYKITGLVSKSKHTGSYEKVLKGIRTTEFVALPIDSLPHDGYKLEFMVKAGKKKTKTEETFYIRWSGLPASAKDLDTAIDQLKYIATRKEWKKLRKSKGDTRLEEYNTFWKRHDPTPGTDINEAMIAHYNRIEYANRHFSVMQRDGWKTDMGMLYVLLGAPDDIFRESYPVDSKPYQIWRYYRINREFMFYDYTGFGDYRFASPFSIYEIQRYLRN
jgi:GWxTD domain-containing protein